MFKITTTDGRTIRSYIEEADAANGIWVNDGDDITLIRWDEVASLTRTS